MRYTYLLPLALAVPATLAGCVETATVLEITGVIRPTGTAICLIEGGNAASISSGTYDPTFSSALGYTMGLRLENHMADESYDPVTSSSTGADYRPEANTVNVVGIDTCFYREEDPALDITELTGKGEVLVDCTSLPEEQQSFITSSATIQAGESQDGEAVIQVLADDDLRVLYGDAFQPKDIPATGGILNPDSPGEIIYVHMSEDPTDDNRDESWGNYPADRDDRVVIQAKAHGKTQSGWVVKSNEFHFPIEVTVGTLIDRCGYMTLIKCNNCADNCDTDFTDAAEERACWLAENDSLDCSGTCSNDSSLACFNYAFSGGQPNMSAQPCLFYQATNPLACEQKFGCSDI